MDADSDGTNIFKNLNVIADMYQSVLRLAAPAGAARLTIRPGAA